MAVHTQEERIDTLALPSAITVRRQILFSALATAACLFGGLLVGFTDCHCGQQPAHAHSQPDFEFYLPGAAD